MFTLFIGKGQHFAAGNGGEREKGLYLYTYCVKIDYIHSNKSSSENKFSWHIIESGDFLHTHIYLWDDWTTVERERKKEEKSFPYLSPNPPLYYSNSSSLLFSPFFWKHNMDLFQVQLQFHRSRSIIKHSHTSKNPFLSLFFLPWIERRCYK